jgi:hypothetical protein
VVVRMTLRAAVALALVCVGTATPARGQELDITGRTARELLDDANQRIARMQSALGDVNDLRDRTQSEDRDLTKVRCINDKLASIQGFLRLSTDSRTSLEEQIARNDREALEHQYTLVVIASQRVANLQNEAAQCAGEILTFAGDTEQSATVDSDIPELDVMSDDVANRLLDRLAPDSALPEATPFQ